MAPALERRNYPDGSQDLIEIRKLRYTSDKPEDVEISMNAARRAGLSAYVENTIKEAARALEVTTKEIEHRLESGERIEY